MSLKYEQYRALKMTRKFLYDLLTAKTRPKTIKEIKEKALMCLKHYPPLDDQGQPFWSNDDYTDDREL